jgi:2-keto-3-deoxy-L-fuconate dehydrogenase
MGSLLAELDDQDVGWLPINRTHFVVRTQNQRTKLGVMKLRDRVAIVTGGASGIGAASARLFAAEGAKVAVVDQDKDGLAKLAKEIDGLAIVADVSSDAQAKDGVAQVIDKWGRVDVLLTAAGVSLGGTVDTIDEAAWDRTFAVNVKGTFLWIHHAIQPMIAAGSGAIVTVGSQLAQASPGKNAAYVASKGAIASFTKTMAVDHAKQGIRVNALMPGVIDTPMPARSLKRYADPDAMRAYWKERHPIGRIGKPEEVARAALFLASDDASFITGHLMFVDGALTCPENSHPSRSLNTNATGSFAPSMPSRLNGRAAGATGSKPSSAPRARR